VLHIQIIDLSLPDLAPEGWAAEASPPQVPATDISVYELHIRDFSASDASVPQEFRGKYGAFALVRAFNCVVESLKSSVFLRVCSCYNCGFMPWLPFFPGATVWLITAFVCLAARWLHSF
jgi:hypothetical protein